SRWSPLRPTNSSPCAARRESTLTPRGPGSAPPRAGSATRRAPDARATLRASQRLTQPPPRTRAAAPPRRSQRSPADLRRAIRWPLCDRRPGRARQQRFPGDRDVVEGLLAPVGELLPPLMTLARDHHHVALAGPRDRREDCLAPIGDRPSRRRLGRPAARVARVLGPAAPPVDPTGAGHYLGDDLRGVLRARVVRGDDRHVGQGGSDLAHQRALAPIAVSTGADPTPPPPPALARARQLARRAQDVLQRVGSVGVVDQHGEILALVHRLESSR